VPPAPAETCPRTICSAARPARIGDDSLDISPKALRRALEAAARFDVHFLRAKAMLEDVGIRPVYDPVEFLTTFYDRRRVEAFEA
jgi:hypothetical protein